MAEQPRDLEDRTFEFAKDIRAFVRTLPKTVCNLEDVKQLIRASGSVGSNYIEANESLGKKDFRLHIKIACKEAKESRYFLRLLDSGNSDDIDMKRSTLVQECTELIKIFSAILNKSS